MDAALRAALRKDAVRQTGAALRAALRRDAVQQAGAALREARRKVVLQRKLRQTRARTPAVAYGA
ncbi:MAG: hypothetical protein KF850_20175 [Labilithrix sp.]|nr:hypothetical protein [Labilithrix sp.]